MYRKCSTQLQRTAEINDRPVFSPSEFDGRFFKFNAADLFPSLCTTDGGFSSCIGLPLTTCLYLCGIFLSRLSSCPAW